MEYSSTEYAPARKLEELDWGGKDGEDKVSPLDAHGEGHGEANDRPVVVFLAYPVDECG